MCVKHMDYSVLLIFQSAYFIFKAFVLIYQNNSNPIEIFSVVSYITVFPSEMYVKQFYPVHFYHVPMVLFSYLPFIVIRGLLVMKSIPLIINIHELLLLITIHKYLVVIRWLLLKKITIDERSCYKPPLLNIDKNITWYNYYCLWINKWKMYYHS